jgi:hypothetical protein
MLIPPAIQTHRLGQESLTAAGGAHGTWPAPNLGPSRVSIHPLWQPSRTIPLEGIVQHRSHGGGDIRMLNKLFGPRPGEKVEEGMPASKLLVRLMGRRRLLWDLRPIRALWRGGLWILRSWGWTGDHEIWTQYRRGQWVTFN